MNASNYSSKFINFVNWEASPQLSSALAMLPAFSKFKIGYYSLPNLSHPISSSSSTFSSELKTLTLLLQGHISTPHILQIHARIFRFDADQNDLIATRLIGHYPPEFSIRVFNHLRNPNIFPSNAIIRVLSEERLLLQAISIFKFLKTRSLSPNDFTFSFLLKACFQSTEDARNVKQIHTHIVKSGFNLNTDVCNGLLAVYAKGVRDLVSAQVVFDEMPHKGMVFSWTCLIAGYAKLNRSEEVLALFLRMIEGNLMPEDDTMVSILSACSGLEICELEKWQKLLSDFDGSNDNVNGFLHDSADTILIYLYGKQGKIEMSRELFDRIAGRGGTKRSVLPWNTMINCYAQNCLPLEALSLFRLMITGSNPRPNHVTMVSVLSSCAQVGDLDLGRWIHNYMKTGRHKGLLESNTFLATAFIDMYSKCGNLERAKEVFDTMASKDVVAFNAMIMSLAINGKGEEALNLFSKMIENGINPNGGTFLGIISACNHSGLVSEGRRVFKNMTLDYSIVPELEHYACYTDLLARMGYIEEALEVVNSMPVEPNGLVWGALLGGCLANSRVDLAFDIARRLVKVDPNNSGGYVMLSNVYASGHRWSELSELRGLMKERGVRKQPGCSWISVDGVVHEFIVGSTSHPQIQKTYNVLDGLSKEMRSVGA